MVHRGASPPRRVQALLHAYGGKTLVEKDHAHLSVLAGSPFERALRAGSYAGVDGVRARRERSGGQGGAGVYGKGHQ